MKAEMRRFQTTPHLVATPQRKYIFLPLIDIYLCLRFGKGNGLSIKKRKSEMEKL